MAQLDEALAQARQGKLSVIGLVGEAGAGKSRLCYEFTERCRSEGLPVLEAHCVSHGQMIPFIPVLELLRGYFGVSELDDARVAREKIAGRLLLLDESFKDVLPLIFDFLGVPDPARPAPQMEPEQRKMALFEGLERMLQYGDNEGVSVLVWEDLHWIDGASDAFLAGMIDLLVDAGEIVIVNFRPGYTAEWMNRPYYKQISLVPLGAEAIDELLGDLLGPDESVRGLAQRIRQQTSGNPFFIEEVVRAFVENGSLQGHRGAYRLARVVEDVILPPTVHGVLAARIDRLSEADKHVLETSAVLGKRFAESLLIGVLGTTAAEVAASLATLTEGGFIEQAQAYPEVEYIFHHPLTQEVAYRQQLGSRRAETHRKVAEAIEAECCPTNKEAALLAHHWEGAGNVRNAVVWSKKAAEWAMKRDLAEARRHWLKARQLLDTCEECEESIAVGIVARDALIEIGWKLGRPLDEARGFMEEALKLAERGHDAVGKARVVAAYAMAQLFAGLVEQGLKDLQHAAEIARDTEDNYLKINLHSRLAYMNLLAGRLDEANRLIDIALALSPSAPGAAVGLSQSGAASEWMRGFKALPRLYRGDGRDVMQDLAEAIAAARAAADRPNESMLHGICVTAAWFLGDAEQALTHARQQVALAEQLGTPTLISGAYDSLGVAYTLNGRWAEAVSCTERALQNARTSGTLLQSEAVFATNLAAAYLGKGEIEKARTRASESVEVARRRATPLFECRARLVLARALLAGESPEIDRAAEVLDEALAIVERTNARGYEPFLRVERACIAGLRGDEVGRARETLAAERLFLAMGADAHAQRLRDSRERAAAS
jgi:adenylate cyclase